MDRICLTPKMTLMRSNVKLPLIWIIGILSPKVTHENHK